ncbi:MAG TPA: hypothetical protein VGB04_01010 [Allosphingosinicella sp.]|jgi:hypothetical protein
MVSLAIGSTRPCGFAGLAAVILLASSCNRADNDDNNNSTKTALSARLPSAAVDQAAWELFAKAVTPSAVAGKVSFETWASDQDIYVNNPCPPGSGPSAGCNVPTWPAGAGLAAAKSLQTSLLGLSHGKASLKGGKTIQTIGPAQPCIPRTDKDAGFPSGKYACVGEEVRRDRASFDYIVGNGLWSLAGLKAFFGTAKEVAFPNDSLQIKADWIPVSALAKWLGKDAAFVTANFYTANASLKAGDAPTAIAMTSMHVAVKTAQFPNWIWANFENAYTPGRCDETGCVDGFGARQPTIPASAQTWGQYGACPKTSAAQSLLSAAKAPAIFANYCLTGTQTEFGTTANPTRLGSPVIEPLNAGVPLAQSSCISCHVGASFTASGFNFPNDNLGPNAVPKGARGYDFMWGLLGAN